MNYFYIKIKKCSDNKLFAGIYDIAKNKWQKWLSTTVIGNVIDEEGKCINCNSSVYHRFKGDYICSSCGANVSIKVYKAPKPETLIDPKTLLKVDDLDEVCVNGSNDDIPF